MLARFAVTLVIAAALGAVFVDALCAGDRAVSIHRIAEAIQKHIAHESERGNGHLHLEHEGKELLLKLVRVHMEYLADLGDGVQFACVDLIGTDGPVYDVDFFMKGSPGDMTVTETTVHKVNGQPLYTWEQEETGIWKRVHLDNATPGLLGVVHGQDEFEFIYRVHLPKISEEARIWIPLAQSGSGQTVDMNIVTPLPGRQLSDSNYGNKVLFLTLGSQESDKTLEVQYHVKTTERAPYPASEEESSRYTNPELLVPINDEFRDIAGMVTHDKATDLLRARALYDHVIDKFRYHKFGEGWGRGDAVYACSARSGNCTDFHSYFMSITRAIDIPARFVMGAAIPSERNDGGIDGYHCWSEFYADGQWWPVDISEAYKNSSLKTYYFGHQPANRFTLSVGRDLMVDPGPMSGPINFLAFPIFESGGEEIPVKTEFRFQRKRSGSSGKLPAIQGSRPSTGPSEKMD